MTISREFIGTGEVPVREEEVEVGGIDFAYAIQKCVRFYRLYVALFLIFAIIGLVYYLWVPREYTAVAVLGPVTSSPPNSTSLFSAAAGALGTRLSSGADAEQMFTEYSQVLLSTRLSESLIEKHGVLKTIFSDRWDESTRHWRVGLIQRIKNFFSGAYPETAPTVDDLDHYLATHMTVSQVAPVTSSSILSSSNILSVSFEFENPYLAQTLLEYILGDADYLLRSDQERDVDARISHLEEMLPRVAMADQKNALISVLTNQLETQTLISSDKRYASALIDPPHASLIPTSPKLRLIFLLVLSAALVVGTGLILYLPADHALMKVFDRRKMLLGVAFLGK